MRRRPTAAVAATLLPLVLAACGGDAASGATVRFRGPAPTDLVVTPFQTEGPYYPVAIPADHDNDLTVVEGVSGTAAGRVIVIDGRLRYSDGAPVPDATVEIWQVDANGVYLHPDDPGVAARDPAFQSYGEATTDADGGFRFRTIYPGYYEGRALHIHLKVRVAGAEALTSQLYFADDPALAGDRIYRSAGPDAAAMTLVPVETTLAGGESVMVADHTIVLSAP